LTHCLSAASEAGEVATGLHSHGAGTSLLHLLCGGALRIGNRDRFERKGRAVGRLSSRKDGIDKASNLTEDNVRIAKLSVAPCEIGGGGKGCGDISLGGIGEDSAAGTRRSRVQLALSEKVAVGDLVGISTLAVGGGTTVSLKIDISGLTLSLGTWHCYESNDERSGGGRSSHSDRRLSDGGGGRGNKQRRGIVNIDGNTSVNDDHRVGINLGADRNRVAVDLIYDSNFCDTGRTDVSVTTSASNGCIQSRCC